MITYSRKDSSSKTTASMRVNASKSKILEEQVEYLGYWITRQGIQQVNNKFGAILNHKRTTPIYCHIHLLPQHVVMWE
jgi:hypothetical protein